MHKNNTDLADAHHEHTAVLVLQTDPEAAKVVFEAGVQNLVMVPLEVTHTALATPAVMQRMMQRQTPFLELMQKLLMFFAQTYKEVFSFEHPPLHDPLAVFFVACPSAFTVSLHTQKHLSLEGLKTRLTCLAEKWLHV